MMAFFFGVSQFISQGMMCLFYYVAGQFMFHLQLDPTDLFIAMYAMLFGAISMGNAQSFGPDVGKANAAANSIFKIIDSKSHIDPMGEDEINKRPLVQDNSFRGEIEFRDVWFRYPTRKSDWILKGLNLKIN